LISCGYFDTDRFGCIAEDFMWDYCYKIVDCLRVQQLNHPTTGGYLKRIARVMRYPIEEEWLEIILSRVLDRVKLLSHWEDFGLR